MKQAAWIAPDCPRPSLSRASDIAGHPVPKLVAHASLVGLAGSVLVQRFQWWRGRTGRRYMFSMFRLLAAQPEAGLEPSLEACPRYDAAVVLAVACDAQGHRRILHMDETGSLPDLFFEGSGLRQALRQGANEIHFHLLAEDAASREVILRDLEG